MNDFFRDSLLFSGRIPLTIGFIGSGGDEGAESFIPGMRGNVHASAGEDVVVGNDDGRSVELIECWVAAHDCCLCVFSMRKLLDSFGDLCSVILNESVGYQAKIFDNPQRNV